LNLKGGRKRIGRSRSTMLLGKTGRGVGRLFEERSEGSYGIAVIGIGDKFGGEWNPSWRENPSYVGIFPKNGESNLSVGGLISLRNRV